MTFSGPVLALGQSERAGSARSSDVSRMHPTEISIAQAETSLRTMVSLLRFSFLTACLLALLALPHLGNCQGTFVNVDVPEFGTLPGVSRSSHVEVTTSGTELENGSFAPMFPVVFTAAVANNVGSCRVRVSTVQPADVSVELDTYNFDTFSTESACTLRFLPYTLQDVHDIEVEFEIGLLSSDETVAGSTSVSLGPGPFGGSCTTTTPVVREFLDPVAFSCAGFQAEDGSQLLAYVTSVAFLGRDQSNGADDDDDDDDDDDGDESTESPLVGGSDSYSVSSLAVNEFETVTLVPPEEVNTSHLIVDVRDNGSIGTPDTERRFYFHLVDTTTGAHRRERLSVRVENISDSERDSAIKDIFASTLQPYINDVDAFQALNSSAKLTYSYQYYLVASSIRNRLFTDKKSVSEDQSSIMRSLAGFSEDMTAAFLETSPAFGVSPIILALEAVIMPFSDSTAISYDQDVYMGALRSVDLLLQTAAASISLSPYNQAALVRVTSAAVEALDKIRSSSSRTGTLLTPEVATVTRGLVSRIQDIVYPSLLCGAPAFFDRNNYITLLHQVNTVTTFVRTPLVLPVGQQKDAEFLMPAVAFTGTDVTASGCLLYDLSDMSDRLFPAVSSSPCVLSVSTCTFREASGSFSEQAIQTPSDDPIMITFNVPNGCEPSGSSSETWSSVGCEPVSQSRGELVCACTHLTDFTALMDSTNEGGSSSNGVAAQVSNVYWWLSLGFVLAAIIIVVAVAIVYDFFRIRKRRRIYNSMSPTPISGDSNNTRAARRTLETSSI